MNSNRSARAEARSSQNLVPISVLITAQWLSATESLFAAHKRETVTMTERGRFTDEAEARRETFRWIAFHNHRRRHRRAVLLSPADYEQRYYRQARLPDGPATLISIPGGHLINPTHPIAGHQGPRLCRIG